MKLKKVLFKIIAICIILLLVISLVFATTIVLRGKKYSEIINCACKTYKVETSLVYAVIYTESKFDRNAVSNKGAIGLMQIMPKTAEFIAEISGIVNGYDIKDAKTNINFGVCYLSYLFKKYGSELLVLACYNAGEGNVAKWQENGEITLNNIPYKETASYVKRVLRRKNIAANL